MSPVAFHYVATLLGSLGAFNLFSFKHVASLKKVKRKCANLLVRVEAGWRTQFRCNRMDFWLQSSLFWLSPSALWGFFKVLSLISHLLLPVSRHVKEATADLVYISAQGSSCFSQLWICQTK